MDRFVEVNIKRAEKYLEAVGKYAQVVQVGDDLGLQDRMQISPEMYRKRVKPRHRELYKFIKEHSDAYLMLHSCGSIYPIIQDLIDIGVDALNPVQISAKDMDSEKLKSEFGRELTFWGGGCDTQSVLPRGSIEDVRIEVEKRISDFAPGGGFIFTQVHNIQPETPAANVDAMFRAAKEYGVYTI